VIGQGRWRLQSARPIIERIPAGRVPAAEKE